MALTFGNFKTKQPATGGWRSGYVDITLDGSYATGGWAISAANLNLGTLYQLVPPSSAVGTGVKGFPLRWDHVTGKLLAFQGAASSATGMNEIDAADISGEVVRCYYEGW